MKKLLFLVNPVSGAGAGVALAGRIAHEMRSRMTEGDYDIIFTTADATAQTRKMAPEYETVVATGGDGTISRIARGIAGLQAPPRLGVIPLGTGNDCARSLGIFPVRHQGGLGALIELIMAGNTRPIDLLRFGQDHMFINYAGLGRDAAIAATFDRLRCRAPFKSLCALGGSKLLYMLLALACARQHCAPGIKLSYTKDNGTAETLQFRQPLCQLLISNITSYGGGTCISSTSCMDDEKFEVVIMQTSSRWVLLHLGRLTGRPYDAPPLSGAVIQTRSLCLNPATCSSAQIDGETIAIKPGEPLNVRAVTQLRIIAAQQT